MLTSCGVCVPYKQRGKYDRLVICKTITISTVAINTLHYYSFFLKLNLIKLCMKVLISQRLATCCAIARKM